MQAAIEHVFKFNDKSRQQTLTAIGDFAYDLMVRGAKAHDSYISSGGFTFMFDEYDEDHMHVDIYVDPQFEDHDLVTLDIS